VTSPHRRLDRRSGLVLDTHDLRRRAGEMRTVQSELIDLEPVLRDAIVLELPFQPVCRPDCRGLCPDCGLDLNSVDEHDHDDAVDLRWSKLTQFESGGETS